MAMAMEWLNAKVRGARDDNEWIMGAWLGSELNFRGKIKPLIGKINTVRLNALWSSLNLYF